MWNVNVFDPPMAIDVAVWLGATESAPSPLPTRRATLTISPEALLNAIVEIGSSLPAAAFWSLQVAVSVPRPLSVDDGLRRARRVVGDLEDVAEHGRLGDVGDELAGQAALVHARAVGRDELAGGLRQRGAGVDRALAVDGARARDVVDGRDRRAAERHEQRDARDHQRR